MQHTIFSGKDIIRAIDKYKVTHLCGAPIILQMIIDHKKFKKRTIETKIMTAASPPPPNVLEEIEDAGFSVTHVYGLTESYGPAVICEWHPEWNKIKSSKRRALCKLQRV